MDNNIFWTKQLTFFVLGLKTIAGPVYMSENNKHNFDVIDKHLDTLKEVHGPIYVNENTKHSFSEIQKAAEKITGLNFPVLNTGEAKNHFSEIIKTAETLKNLSGPVYISDESGHKYSEFIKAACLVLVAQPKIFCGGGLTARFTWSELFMVAIKTDGKTKVKRRCLNHLPL